MIRKYALISKIASGTFGTIYKACKDFKFFAIKKISLENQEKNEIDKIKEEAKLLEKIKNCLFYNNNYIVQYFESFQEKKDFYIVMEYCDKGDLNSLIQKRKEKKKFFSEDEIWKIFIQLLIGIGLIHKNKIIHRDLKPLNIFLTIKGGKKIGDFGVSKLLKNQKKANTFVGTLYYISPEMINNKAYDYKCDIWSLGCILYELCTFKHPFEGDNQIQICSKIMNGEYDNIKTVNKNCVSYSKLLDNMISKLLNINPNKRPSILKILSDNFILEKALQFNLIEEIKNILPEVKGEIKVFIKNQVNLQVKGQKRRLFRSKSNDKLKKKEKNDFINDNKNIKEKKDINNNDKKNINNNKKIKNKKNEEQKPNNNINIPSKNLNYSIDSNTLEDNIKKISKDDEFSSFYESKKFCFDEIDIKNTNINIENNQNMIEKENENVENNQNMIEKENENIENNQNMIEKENENFENEIKKLIDEKLNEINKIKEKLNQKDYEYIMDIYEKAILTNNEDNFNKKFDEYLNKKKFSDDIKENLILLFANLLSIDSKLQFYIH